ncbi:MAG TPA: hypothetical protein VFU21_21470 [Kofleriaceae bacterium]|nr:hypothetical protein [Kofleriaceae bacterium]
MSERFVIVHRTYDPIQADLLGDLLRDSGVAARVTGTRSGAAIGVGQNILEVSIAVPEAQAGEATDFLEAYFEHAPADEPDEEPEEEAREQGERPLRPLFAAGSAFITFGVGHVYARRPWTAAALAAGQVVAIYFLAAGQQWDDWTIGATLLLGCVAFDLVGSVLAVRAHNAGVRRGGAFQTGIGLAYASAAMGLALAVGPTLADPTRGPKGETAEEPSQRRDDQSDVRSSFKEHPPFPPLTHQHPANPSAD